MNDAEKREGTVLTVESMPVELETEFFERLRQSGMRGGEACRRCTRSGFLTRDEDTSLCPPCRRGTPDGWTPAHSVRKAETGSPLADPLLAVCALCQGNGVVNWQPFGPHEPRCPSCQGRGQR